MEYATLATPAPTPMTMDTVTAKTMAVRSLPVAGLAVQPGRLKASTGKQFGDATQWTVEELRANFVLVIDQGVIPDEFWQCSVLGFECGCGGHVKLGVR